MTAAATGAAASPPVEAVSSMTTATATWGSSAGAKPMNQAWLRLGSSLSAVPVLPATVTPTPDSAARVPVPSRTTSSIIAASSAAFDGLITWPSSSGSPRCTSEPPRSTIRVMRRGAMAVPPLAIAPATIAICTGVTASCSWPIARRAVSSSWSSLGSTSSPLRRPEIATSGRSIGGRSPNP